MEERDIDRELPISLAVCPIELAVIFSRHRLDALCSKTVEAAGILRSPERFADGLRLAVAGIDAGKHIEFIDPVYRKLYRFLLSRGVTGASVKEAARRLLSESEEDQIS